MTSLISFDLEYEFRPQACQNAKFGGNRMTQTAKSRLPKLKCDGSSGFDPEMKLISFGSGVQFDVHIRIRHHLGSRGPSCGALGLP